MITGKLIRLKILQILKYLKITTYILIILTLSLAILFFQKQLQTYIPYLRLWVEKILTLVRSPLVWGFGLGINFGLISCPVCGVPLTVYIAGCENNVRSAWWAIVSFTLGRFVIFTGSGILAGLLGWALLQSGFQNLLPFLFISAGTLMVILGLSLLGLSDMPGLNKLKKIFQRHSPAISYARSTLNIVPRMIFYLRYFLWGGLLGVACSLEGLGFVIPVWLEAVSRANVGYAVLSVCLFGLGAFIPPGVMVILGWTGLHLAAGGKRVKILRTARFVGALVLFIIGGRYIWMGWVNAKSLLF